MPRTENAPIVIFAYKRPTYLLRAIESLKQCKEFDASPVYVFVDGPKQASEEALVEQAYSVAREQLPRASIVKQSANLGLARSVSAGVAHVCQAHGRAIVVEDDLVVSPGFLGFLNAALDRYESAERVMHISAYMYPTPSSRTAVDASFLPTIGSWGWATWHRAWKQYDDRACGWEALKKDRALRTKFDLEGDADFSSMLYAQMAGHIDSWVIRWYWTVFQKGGVVLYPPRSLTLNRGFDSSGTHGSRFTARVLATETMPELTQARFPRVIEMNSAVLQEVRQLLRRVFGGRARRALRNFMWPYRRLIR